MRSLPPSESDSSYPRALTARYRIQGVLGQGGFGVVLAAEDRQLDRPVALKLLHAEVADQEVRRRFEREARLTAALAHPHVVELYAFGVDEGQAWIAYELVPGGTLKGRLDSLGPLAPEEVRRLGCQAASALQVAHDAGVLHRDVKPENMLLRAGGDLVLADFGIARSSRDGTMLTAAGLVLGTPAYMAPELLMGENPSPASDQFALAASLYHLATGQPVYGTFEVTSVLDVIRRNWGGVAGADLPEALRAPLVRGLRPLPRDRYPTLRDLQADLSGTQGSIRHAPTSLVPVALAAPEDSPTVRLQAPLVTPGSGAPAPAPWRLLVLVALGCGLLATAWGWRPSPELGEEQPTEARPGPAPWGEVEAALEVVAAGHRQENGGLLASVDEHAYLVSERILDATFSRNFHKSTEALGRWLRASRELTGSAEPEDPRRVRLLTGASDIFEHCLLDRLRLRSAMEREITEVTTPRDRRAEVLETREQFDSQTEDLGVSAIALFETWGALDGAGDDWCLLAFRGLLGARLPLGGADLLSARLAQQVRASRGAAQARLAYVHRVLLEALRLTPELELAQRLREARAPATLPPDSLTLRYFRTHFFLCWSHTTRATEEEEQAARRYLDVAEEAVRAGRAREVEAVLNQLPGSEKDWQPEPKDKFWDTGENLPRHPLWTETLARLRSLHRLVESRQPG